ALFSLAAFVLGRRWRRRDLALDGGDPLARRGLRGSRRVLDIMAALDDARRIVDDALVLDDDRLVAHDPGGVDHLAFDLACLPFAQLLDQRRIVANDARFGMARSDLAHRHRRAAVATIDAANV